MNERLQRGVVVVYGPNRKERAKRMKRVERSRQYLIRVRHIEPERVLIVDGGHGVKSATSLNLYSIGGLVSRVYLFPEMDPAKKK